MRKWIPGYWENKLIKGHWRHEYVYGHVYRRWIPGYWKKKWIKAHWKTHQAKIWIKGHWKKKWIKAHWKKKWIKGHWITYGWNPSEDESEILMTPKNNYRGGWTTKAIENPNVEVTIQAGFLKVKPIGRRRSSYSGRVRVTPTDKPSWIGEWHKNRPYKVGLSGSKPFPEYSSRCWTTTESPAPPTPSEDKGTLEVKAVEKGNESNIIEDATIKVTQDGSEVFTAEGSGSKKLDPGSYTVQFEENTPSGWLLYVEGLPSWHGRNPEAYATKYRRVKAGETTTVKVQYEKMQYEKEKVPVYKLGVNQLNLHIGHNYSASKAALHGLPACAEHISKKTDTLIVTANISRFKSGWDYVKIQPIDGNGSAGEIHVPWGVFSGKTQVANIDWTITRAGEFSKSFEFSCSPHATAFTSFSEVTPLHSRAVRDFTVRLRMVAVHSNYGSGESSITLAKSKSFTVNVECHIYTFNSSEGSGPVPL